MKGIPQINNSSKSILLLRIWHSFEPEKLQNIDGKGNDLMPLPNIQDDFSRQLNYVDKLLEASTIEPTVFIYSGKLSAQQKQMFEDLHEKATKKGGNLYVLCYEGYFEEEINKQTSLLKPDLPKSEFVDFQRLFILRNQELIFSTIKEKYNFQLEANGIFYSDFDNFFLEDLECIKSVSTEKIRVPISSYEKERKLGSETNNTFSPIIKALQDLVKDLKEDCERLAPDKRVSLVGPFKEFCFKAEINSIFYPRYSTFLSRFLNKTEVSDYKYDPENYGGFRFFLERALGEEIHALTSKEEEKNIIRHEGYCEWKIPCTEAEVILKGEEIIASALEGFKLPNYQGCKDRLWKEEVSTLILKDYGLTQEQDARRAVAEFKIGSEGVRAHGICENEPASKLTGLKEPEKVKGPETRNCSFQ